MVRETLYIIDFSNLLHRAAHAMSDLSTASGFPTGAIYGTFTMLSKLMIDKKVQNMVVCYDWQGDYSIRKEYYPNYKCSRDKKPHISAQEFIARRVMELLDLATVEESGYEADDLIGSAVEYYKGQYDIVILTGDKDMLQLIEPGVTVYDSMKKCYYGDPEIQKKFGVRPNQIVDFLAIAGDKGDDVPGVKGIGKVGACKLLAQFNDLEDIYANIDQVTGANHNKLIKNKDDAFVSKRLVSLVKDRHHLFTELDICVSPQPNGDLTQLFSKLEFEHGIRRLTKLWQTYK